MLRHVVRKVNKFHVGILERSFLWFLRVNDMVSKLKVTIIWISAICVGEC